jgi:hypothetical protein
LPEELKERPQAFRPHLVLMPQTDTPKEALAAEAASTELVRLGARQETAAGLEVAAVAAVLRITASTPARVATVPTDSPSSSPTSKP